MSDAVHFTEEEGLKLNTAMNGNLLAPVASSPPMILSSLFLGSSPWMPRTKATNRTSIESIKEVIAKLDVE